MVTFRPTSALTPIRLLASLALTSGLLLAGAAPALAAERSIPDTVVITGTGDATGVATMAALSVSVEATKPSADEAMAAENTAAHAFITAVEGQGVSDSDIQTTGIWLNPVYADASSQSKVSGYAAGESFSVTVRDVAKTGAIVQTVASTAGDAGRVDGVSFDVPDHTALQQKARESAYGDAHSKAEQYATLSGRPLGRLISLSETDTGGPHPVAFAATKSSIPVEPGEIRDEVSVKATYELI